MAADVFLRTSVPPMPHSGPWLLWVRRLLACRQAQEVVPLGEAEKQDGRAPQGLVVPDPSARGGRGSRRVAPGDAGEEDAAAKAVKKTFMSWNLPSWHQCNKPMVEAWGPVSDGHLAAWSPRPTSEERQFFITTDGSVINAKVVSVNVEGLEGYPSWRTRARPATSRGWSRRI